MSNRFEKSTTCASAYMIVPPLANPQFYQARAAKAVAGSSRMPGKCMASSNLRNEPHATRPGGLAAKARGVRLGRHGSEVLAPQYRAEANQRRRSFNPSLRS